MSSAICFNLDQSKMLSSGNGLNLTFCMAPESNPPYEGGDTFASRGILSINQ